MDPMTLLALGTTYYNWANTAAPEFGYQVQSLFPQDSTWGDLAGAFTSSVLGGPLGALGYASQADERAAQAEREQLAADLMSGIVPADQYNSIANQLNAYYGDARTQLGGYLGRAGLGGSTIASEQMADTYSEQGRDLANALADRALQRQQMGMNLLGMNQDIMAQRRAEQAQVGSGIANTLSLLHENRMANEAAKPKIGVYPVDNTYNPIHDKSKYPMLHNMVQKRPIGTQRGGGGYSPSVNPTLSIQNNGYGGGNRSKNTFAKVRSRTGAQQLKTPSFSGR